MRIVNICVEMKRAVCSAQFVISVLLGFFLFNRNTLPEMLQYGLEDTHPLDLLSISMAASTFSPFSPIFALFPFASSFVEDHKSGFDRLISVRIGTKRYIQNKIIAVAFSGAAVMGMIFSSSIFIYMLFADGTFSSENYIYMNGSAWYFLLQTGHVCLFYVVRISLAMLFGAVWSLAGLSFSVIYLNRYTVLIAPFVLFQVAWTYMENSIFNPLYMLRGDFIGPGRGYLVYIIQTANIAVLSVISYIGMKWRLQ